MPGYKKNGANREAKKEQNTVKPKQVKKMQSSPHFVLRKAAQPPFVGCSPRPKDRPIRLQTTAAFRFREQKYTGKGGKFCPERR